MYPHSSPPLHGLNEAAPTPTGMLDAYVVYVTVEAQTDSTRSASSRRDDICATRPMFRRVGGHAGGSRQRCQLSYGIFLTDVASLSAHSRGVTCGAHEQIDRLRLCTPSLTQGARRDL
jgi:hypothetical protein